MTEIEITDHRILHQVYFGEGAARTAREIADLSEVAEAYIVRRMPELRRAGYNVSWTPDGRYYRPLSHGFVCRAEG